ncbi:MAG: 4-hydroxy-3-methylbut-2-enyl diphosphate reductase [candidate division KSB1 bacterium]|nr:4-hydroxy-3-methylbut-2-enyl diphosphate reductase [candidate division KSB1 bacterium]
MSRPEASAELRDRGGLIVEIDRTAGFCPGVQRAVRMAEEHTRAGGSLAVIGELIHNRREVDRLRALGLRTVEQGALDGEGRPQPFAGCRRLLIRTHGLPRGLQERLQREGFELVDGTCPVVRRSQELVRQHAARGYQVLVVGKPRHPEVVALVGQAPEAARAVSGPDEVGDLDPSRPVFVLAQTTIDEGKFLSVLDRVRELHPRVAFRNTICRAVSGRYGRLREFAARNDVVLFVGGRNSSNTAQLYRVCQAVNPRSYWIESAEEVEPEWLEGARRIGISGGASTPRWQLEEVARYIQIKAQPMGECKEVTSNG